MYWHVFERSVETRDPRRIPHGKTEPGMWGSKTTHCTTVPPSTLTFYSALLLMILCILFLHICQGLFIIPILKISPRATQTVQLCGSVISLISNYSQKTVLSISLNWIMSSFWTSRFISQSMLFLEILFWTLIALASLLDQWIWTRTSAGSNGLLL